MHNIRGGSPLPIVFSFAYENFGINNLYALVMLEFQEMIVSGHDKIGVSFQGTGKEFVI